MSKDILLFFGIIAIILIVTIYLRLSLIQYQGFYEPDGFYHYSVIRAAVNNNFVVPRVLGISGWPGHTLVTEPTGLYWVTLFPYFILRFFGVSYYDVMRLVPLLFAIFDVLGAYYLSRFLSKDKVFGILVMALVATDYGEILKTSALVYRGDTFVSIFLILALIFLIKIFKTNDNNKKLGFMMLSGLFLSLCNIVWNGGAFAFIIYSITILITLVLSVIILNKNMFSDIKYTVFSLFLWFLLVRSYVYANFISEPNQQLIGFSGFGIIISIFIGMCLGYLFFQKKSNILINNKIKRIFIIILIVFSTIGIFYVLNQGIFNKVFINNGFVSSPGFVTASIQELSKPTINNFIINIGLPLLITPMSIFLMLSSLFTNLQLYFWIFILFSSLVYLFLNVENSEGWLTGKFRFLLDFKIETIVMIVYLIITAYLALFVIRFEALVSIPLAIFSAYTLYLILIKLKNIKILKITFILFLLIIVSYTTLNSMQILYNSQLADLITPNFLKAISYVKVNTPTNSTFLTLWPDGSVIEGWGNRTSVTDSVGALNGSRVDTFANWLFNDSPNYNFIVNYSKKPNYILIRYPWLLETKGIFLESGINQSKANNFSYLPLNFVTEIKNNTSLILEFNNNQNKFYTYVIINKTNNVNTFYYKSDSGISPFEYTAFYNINNNNFTIIKETKYNITNNQMLLIEYSNILNLNNQINITNAMALNNNLYKSNMIKLMYFCNNYSCLLNSNQIIFRNFYSNNDSKLFKISYINNQ
ncbi:MAG: hypothetical protein QXD23_02570 [Candidatus Micrarchaeaceae archaeon]